MRPLHRLLAVSTLSLALIAAGTIPAFASDNQGDEDQPGSHPVGGAPEIDPGLLGGAVALVAGGLLILRERRRS